MLQIRPWKTHYDLLHDEVVGFSVHIHSYSDEDQEGFLSAEQGRTAAEGLSYEGADWAVERR